MPQTFHTLMRDACHRAWQRGLLSGFNGNVSLREGQHCRITRAGAAKGALDPEDISLLGLDGTLYEGAPASSESPMHLAIYAALSQTLAIAHCHPRHLLALELKKGLHDFLALPLFEADLLRARLAVVPAFPPGTQELAEAVATASCRAQAVWMSRHGLVCRGASLKEAFALAEELDHMAAVALLL